MSENLPPYLIYGIITAIAAFAGGLGLGVSQWMSAGLRSSTRRVFHFLLSGILWPFRWGITAIKEWRRVSVYRHRGITWDDLPYESKLAVHVQDLSDLAQHLIVWDHLPQQAKDDVRFHDLSELARDLITWADLPQQAKNMVRLQDLSDEAQASIRVRDLPREEKHTLLVNFIIPRLQTIRHEGRLSLFGDDDSITLDETVQISIAQEFDRRTVHQDRVQLTINIVFANEGADFQFLMGSNIGFRADHWAFRGEISNRTRINPTTQTIVVWITAMYFEELIVYSHYN